MSVGDSTPTGETRISWHPAFLDAMRLELDLYHEYLQFNVEYQLTAEPLRIDLLIIKKPSGLVIDRKSVV